MPDINGLKIIQRLKADKSPLPDARIIAITAASDRRLVVNRIRHSGIDSLLFKPLDITALVKTMHHVLEAESSQGSYYG